MSRETADHSCSINAVCACNIVTHEARLAVAVPVALWSVDIDRLTIYSCIQIPLTHRDRATLNDI